jgi:hypothetical protein
MRKFLGIVFLVAGVVILMQGINIAKSVNSQVKQLFTGSPMDKSMYYYIVGTALTVTGVFQIFWPGKK